MFKNIRYLLLALLSLALSSCGLISVQTKNCPFFYGYSFEVINNSPYYLDVSVRGRHYTFTTESGVEVDRLPPGQTQTIGLKNYSGNTMAEATVSLKAWNLPAGGQLAGAASKHLWVAGNYNQADTWIVCEQIFKQPCSTNYW